MPSGDHGRGPDERAYWVQSQERLHRIRGRLRRMEGHLSEMDEHLHELDAHLRHEVEESERWHRKSDGPQDGA